MAPSMLIWLIGTLGALSTLLLLALSAAESPIWRKRAPVASVAAALSLTALPFAFVTDFSTGIQLLLSASNMVIFLLAIRLIVNRLHGDFLQKSTITGLALLLLIVIDVIIGGFMLSAANPLIQHPVLTATLLVSFFVGSIFVSQTLWSYKHYKVRKIDTGLKLRDLPTVTLAIPARNEDHALADCLQAAIASDYPKLEILVLDDCSQDQTSQIIRSFAHSGVRFVRGILPAEDWIGKTQAYQTLSQKANGEFIIFLSVDARLAPQSISKLVAYALSNKVDMVSALPQRVDTYFASNIFQQMRYFWQVALPITGRRVPVAGPCWLINTKTLKKLGGFGAVKHKVIPETTFARELFAKNKYRFIISNSELGVTNAKRWSSQAESALRILYPTYKRQPVIAILAAAFIVVMSVVPIGTLITFATQGNFGPLFWLSLLSTLTMAVAYSLVLIRTNPSMWILATLAMPITFLQEAVLTVISMLSYEFSEVNWKGRNICYPVITYKK